MSEPVALDLAGLLQATLLPASGASLRGVDAHHASFSNLLSQHMQPVGAAETLELVQPLGTDGRPLIPQSPLAPQLPLNTVSAPSVDAIAHREPVTSPLLTNPAKPVRPTAQLMQARVKTPPSAGTGSSLSSSSRVNAETTMGMQTLLRPLVSPGPGAQGSGNPMNTVALTQPSDLSTGNIAGPTLRPQVNNSSNLRKPDGQTRIDQTPAARLLQPQPASQGPDLQIQMAESLPEPAQAEKLAAAATMKLAQFPSQQKDRAMHGRCQLHCRQSLG